MKTLAKNLVHTLGISTCVLGLVLAGPAARSQDRVDINQSRGISVASSYQLEDLDSINLFNGALSVSLPLGQSFPVGGGLAYELQLHSNSNIWHFDRVMRNNNWETVAEPDTDRSNAGLGWNVGFGELIAPNTPDLNDDPNHWVLLEADGSRRKFSAQLHDWFPSATSTYSYSRDGSYLRMIKLGTGEREVESPDGTIRVFRTDGKIRQIRDRYNNQVNIAYGSTPCLPENGLTGLNCTTWTITDSTGRTNRVQFRAITPGINQVGTLELAAFGGATAKWVFDYQVVTVERHSKDSDPNNSATIGVSLLQSVTLPDGSSFDFDYITTSATKLNSFEEPGMLRSMILPTLGKLEWDYGIYLYPTVQERDSFGNLKPDPWDRAEGVWHKRLYAKTGALKGEWTHAQGSRPPTQASLPLNDAREVRTWVTDPLGHQRVHYFLTDSAALFQVNGQLFGYGLPFTALLTDGSGTRFLSQEVFDGTATSTSRLRSQYLRYEVDPSGSGNERVASERTLYDDDPGQRTEVDRSDFDGFGHYRSVTESGNWAPSNTRTTFTDYNPARGTLGTGGFTMWPTSSPWVLETFEEQRVTQDGVTAEQQFCFEAATGFLLRQRIQRSTTPTTTDVVRVFTRDTAGNLIREQDYGGDLQGVSTSTNLCGLGLPSTDQYRVDHTIQHGVRATSQYRTSSGGTLGYKHLDNTIDRNTGLVSQSRDVAGLATDFEYDLLGRQTWIKPSGGGVARDGYVEFQYVVAGPSNRARVNVHQRQGSSKSSSVLVLSIVIFDDFGRVDQERSKLTDGSLIRRRHFHNALGWKTHVSEWARVSGETLKYTVFNDYDPFGRVREIRGADGSTATLSYTGIRLVNRTVGIGTGRNATTGAILETDVTHQEVYDPFGRLFRVREANNFGKLVTDYFYDVGNRLEKVKQTRGAVTQERLFTYDRLGFLVSERHPEKGTFGNGTISYFNLDARGHARRVIDGPNDLTYTYDRAERLTQVKDTFGGALHKEFFYATTNSGADMRRGKLEEARRHNYYPSFGGLDFEVVEHYTYASREGRVSFKESFVGTVDSYSQSFGWSSLGQLDSVGYPDCLHCVPGVEPVRTVNYDFSNGLLSSIPGYADAVTYHAGGLVDTVTYPNGVTWQQGRDPNFLQRPESITVQKDGVTLFSTGTYGYDDAGNVTTIGTDYYLYDHFGRLKEGTAFRAGPLRQTYTYDDFNNLTEITTFFGSLPSTRTLATDPATNRLSAAAYDSAGAMTVWGNYSYERDPLGMIRAYKNPSAGLDLRYAYTADDERILIYDVLANESTWRIRDLNGKVLREFHLDNPTDTWTWKRDWILREGEPLASVSAAEGTRYLHPDHLGSTRAISDDLGNLVAIFYFFPFGEEAGAVGFTEEVLQFTGHERDANRSGFTDDLDYMHARFFSPHLGRFLRPDPARSFEPANPQTWNRYSYVHNDPMNAHDPDGEIAFKLIKSGVRFAIKGGDVAATFAGIIEDVNTLRDPDASGGQKALAVFSLITEAVSPVSLRDGKAIGRFVGAIDDAADGRRVVERGGDGRRALNRGGSGSGIAKQSRAELMKSKRSFERLIAEHRQKLEDFKRDPDAFDNKGLLKGVSDELREKIIQGRILALEKQIKKQEGELQKILQRLGEL